MRLKSKIAIVTGGASGIGLATARRFAAEGAKLAIFDRTPGAAETAAADIGMGAVGIEGDVSKSKDVERAIEETESTFGGLDILINNAGYGFLGTVESIEEDDWDKLMAVNLKGIYLFAKFAIPAIVRRGGGAIVNTGSYTAMVGIKNRAAYVASKGGIVALTRAMALDHVDQKIRVNCVAPGTIQSPYFDAMRDKSVDPEAFQRALDQRSPMNRTGRPEEIANMILWLASDDASFATGGVFTVDGGTSAW
jgi:meso-butanediol dehydrogenase / (S,S)-butanediol dehydrogenase / diacetyl reductase